MFKAGDIWLDFNVDLLIKTEYVPIYDYVEVRDYDTKNRTSSGRFAKGAFWAKSLSDLNGALIERWKATSRLQKMVVGYDVHRTVDDMLESAVEEIAHKVKKYMIDYAPIDESKYKDDVVLKENIWVFYRWEWKYEVRADNIPYATRRNYENALHPQTLHYVERSWENHLAEYQQVLQKWSNIALSEIVPQLIAKSWAGLEHRYR